MTPIVSPNDQRIIRDLAKRYRDLCCSERNLQLKDLWRRLNNMQPCRPMIHVNDGLLRQEIYPTFSPRRVEHDLLEEPERRFKLFLEWRAIVGDDQTFDPWFTVPALMHVLPEGPWGVAMNRERDEISRGWRHRPVFTTPEDLHRLRATEHRVIDSEPLLARMLGDIFGDILPVHIERHTVYSRWGSTHLGVGAGSLFGLQELLMMLYEQPEMVHDFMTFTRDAVLANLRQGEALGDWSRADSQYYRTPALCDALPDPEANSHGAALKEIAWSAHAQEFDGVSPEMFDEFLFNYQQPILDLFGRVTYGCCETLNSKFDILKRLSNLAKITAGPLADPAPYPAAFGEHCVISWRPLASIIASGTFDEVAQRRQLREGLEKLKGCNLEVHLHEPMTVQNDLDRIRRWVNIVREETGTIFGGGMK